MEQVWYVHIMYPKASACCACVRAAAAAVAAAKGHSKV